MSTGSHNQAPSTQILKGIIREKRSQRNPNTIHEDAIRDFGSHPLYKSTIRFYVLRGSVTYPETDFRLQLRNGAGSAYTQVSLDDIERLVALLIRARSAISRIQEEQRTYNQRLRELSDEALRLRNGRLPEDGSPQPTNEINNDL